MVDREDRREGRKVQETGVMVTFTTSRDHQKRASLIVLTHYLPYQSRDGGLTHSTASQFTTRKKYTSNKCQENKDATHPFFICTVSDQA